MASEIKDLIASIQDIVRAIGLLAQTIDNAARLDLTPLKAYTVATVPAAANNTYAQIFVTDETGGATVAYSDGTNWRRVQDRAIVS